MNIFIDTEDMEERYAEGLYKDYLEEQNKQLQQERDKYKSIVDEIGKYLYFQIEIREYDEKTDEIKLLNDVFNKLKELEEGNGNG